MVIGYSCSLSGLSRGRNVEILNDRYFYLNPFPPLYTILSRKLISFHKQSKGNFHKFRENFGDGLARAKTKSFMFEKKFRR